MNDNSSENDNCETLLVEIRDLLKTISKDQKSVGAFIGEDTHKIRGWVFFLGVLLIIDMVMTLILLIY
jgi:hypothetical protein